MPVFVLGGIFALGCGEPPGIAGPTDTSADLGLKLQVRGGTYSDGSGRLGLAVLSTLRDEAGEGPGTPWSGTLLDGQGNRLSGFSYDSPVPGALALWWFPEVPARVVQGYSLRLSDETGRELSTSFVLGSLDSLEVPAVALAPDASSLTWAPVPGAATYLCRVHAGSNVALFHEMTGTRCDVSALPPGSYVVSVLAISEPLGGLRADTRQAPLLPVQMNVSEGRLSFLLGADATAPALQVSAAGGSLHYGTSTPGLAVWLRLAKADGTPPDEAWSVEIVGPGLPVDAPLRLQYPAQAARHLAWSYETRPSPGLYSLTASSGTRRVTARFAVGTPRELAMPAGVSAHAQANGGASVAWRMVPGARSYFVGVWSRDTAHFVTGGWVNTSPYTFPAQHFLPGVSYDVYVAATDVDMTGTEVPTQLVVSEDAYHPVSFVGR